MRILPLPVFSLVTIMLLPTGVNARCDEVKHAGNHPHCSGDDPPPPEQTSCPGDFPAFAYAVEIINKRGHTERSDLMVSNADGSCEVLVHSVTTADTYDHLTFNFDSDSGKYRIAYNKEAAMTSQQHRYLFAAFLGGVPLWSILGRLEGRWQPRSIWE